MATVKTSIIAACCGVMLLGAVSAHAALTSNALVPNGVPNGLHSNSLVPNGAGTNGLSTPQSEGLPFNGLSQSGLGKKNL